MTTYVFGGSTNDEGRDPHEAPRDVAQLFREEAERAALTGAMIDDPREWRPRKAAAVYGEWADRLENGEEVEYLPPLARRMAWTMMRRGSTPPR